MRLRSKVIFVLIVILYALNGLLVAQDLTVYIDPAVKTAGVSEACSVSVAIENVTNMSGFQFDIVFDPAVVQAEDAIVGEFLGSTGRTIFPVGPDIDNIEGKITYGAITFGDAAGVDGSGVLAVVVFTGLADGTTDLDIQNLGISDTNGQPIPVQTITDGQIAVGGILVTFRVTVPGNTPPGDVIYIAGNFNDWDPGPSSQGATGQGYDVAMTSIGNNQWETSLVFTAGDAIEYKYTRGSWATVEKDEAGAEIGNRTLTVPSDDHTQEDVVGSWADLGTFVHDEYTESMPDQYLLSQNYPNPFNPETTIRFSLPEQNTVTLKIYDLMGSEIETLLNTQMQAGNHQVRWSAKHVPSGIYLYRLQAGAYSNTRKLILQK